MITNPDEINMFVDHFMGLFTSSHTEGIHEVVEVVKNRVYILGRKCLNL